MDDMINSVKSISNAKEQEKALIRKTAVGIDVTIINGPQKNAEVSIINNGNIAIVSNKGLKKFALNSKDEFTIVEVIVVSRPDDLDSRGNWEFEIPDNAGELIFTIDENVPPIDRLVRFEDTLSNVRVGNYYIEETPVGLRLIDPDDGQCISTFKCSKVNLGIEGRYYEYVKGGFNIVRGEALGKVQRLSGDEIDISVTSGISFNEAPLDGYGKLAYSIIGPGAGSYLGMVLCDVMELDAKELEYYDEDALRRLYSSYVSSLFGKPAYRSQLGYTCEVIQRRALFPILFGIDTTYKLMRDKTYQNIERVDFLGNGKYYFYNEYGTVVELGGLEL